MGVLLAFTIGYVAGGRAGREGLEEVSASLKALRESEEFRGVLKALRSHASHALRELSDALRDPETKLDFDSLLERVQSLSRTVDAAT
jgi:uncharacterized protein YjgD (DUF1641 family)